MNPAEQRSANAAPSDAVSPCIAATPVDGDYEDVAPLPLPHETDQSVESQHEEGTRDVGRQAHKDLSRGLTDTDRRGGDAYQQRTQNNANANTQTPKLRATRKR